MFAALLLAGPSAAGTTSLRITVWPGGRAGPAHHVWTLRCEPAGGTLPRAAAACRALLRLRNPFAPVPPGSACAEIFGGPQEAVVTATFRRKPVHATFRRSDSCEISRWNRVAFLFRPAAKA